LSSIRKNFEIIPDLLKQIFEDNKTDILHQIGALWNESIQRNLAENGRYDGSSSGITIFSGGNRKWVPLAKSTQKNYMLKGYNDKKPTLNRTGTMLSTMEVVPKNGMLYAVVKSPYAAIHQFGGKIKHPGGTAYGYATKKDAENGKVKFLKAGAGFMVLGKTKPHIIEIPARPYIVIQDEDVQEWKQIIMSEILDQLNDRKQLPPAKI
jgi:phage gpG-like protein